MFETHNEIKKTVIRSQHVQRNWDLTKQIPEEDLELLIHAVTNCPSKQNFAFYKAHFITNREKIESIHALTEGLRNMKGEMSTNSQTLANLLVVFEDVDPSQELIDKWKLRDKANLETLKRDQQMAVGVAAGYLNVIASMLGYGTGCCACYNDEEVRQKIGFDKRPLLMMGIGFKDETRNRREHHLTGEMMGRRVKEPIEVVITR